MIRSIKTWMGCAIGLVFAVGAVQAEPRIQSIEPINLVPGQTTEVKLRGNEFQMDDVVSQIWTSFPSTWELIEDRENTNHQLFFNVFVAADSPVGPAAVRLWNHRGTSKPALALIDPSSGVNFK
ncbi:MAG: hypothetical protein AAF226_15740, partial [Verrucomicrobiota bacterium]